MSESPKPLTPASATKQVASFTAKSVGQGVVWEGSLRLLKLVPTMTGIGATAWTYLTNELTATKATLLGLSVMLAGSFSLLIVGAAIRLFRKPAATAGDDSAQTGNGKAVDGHEGCQRTIANLESKIIRLQERDQTSGVQIVARDGQIEQLQAKLDGAKWLFDIATDQAKTIYRFVSITDWRTGQHELLRDDAYLEFLMTIWNRSVYDIILLATSGRISFHGRELTGTLAWKEQPQVIKWANTGQVTLRQALTRDDAVHILNHGSSFDFSHLQIRATGFGNFESVVVPQSLHADQSPPSNRELLVQNPKLSIQAKVLVASFIVDLQEYSSSDDAYISMSVKIRNYRDTPVVVESVELKVLLQDGLIAAAAQYGEIWEKMHIDEIGRLQGVDRKLDNLTVKLPLRLQHAEVPGDVQFVFKGARQVFFNQNVHYELIFTDRTGERHPYEGVINEVEP
jgi:hypothetical protein